MQDTVKNIPENIKQSVSAVAPLLIVVILFVLVGKFGVTKVLEVRSKVVAAQKTEETLKEKLNLLQNLSSSVSPKAGLVSSALPDSNPSLELSSQLDTLAFNQGVALSGLKSTSSEGSASDLNETSASFTIDGTREQIFGFLSGTAKIAPLTTVKKISMTGSPGGVSADINVVSYWAAYPKTLPAVTDPITDLTPTEKQVLNDISGLSQPSFIEVSPSQENLNPLPFGF